MKRRPALAVPIDIEVQAPAGCVVGEHEGLTRVWSDIWRDGRIDFTRTKDEQGIVRTVVTRPKRRRRKRKGGR